MAYPRIAPLLCVLVFLFSEANAIAEEETRFTVYVKQANSNQYVVINSPQPNGFGTTVVTDWEMTDGFGTSATVIGRVQGEHIQTGQKALTWSIFMTFIFQSGWYNGSTIQVMGPAATTNSVWSIIGGTGTFSMARGLVRRSEIINTADWNIQEVKIHVFYTPDTILGDF